MCDDILEIAGTMASLGITRKHLFLFFFNNFDALVQDCSNSNGVTAVLH